jgi:hypothetical protein
MLGGQFPVPVLNAAAGLSLSTTSVARMEDSSLATPSSADGGMPFSDAELTELALAADPSIEPDVDAVPFGAGDPGAALLPEWYMPATLRAEAFGATRRRRAWVVWAIIASLLIVNGYGLCVTYGFPEIAW